MLITVNDESVEIREGTTVAELIDTLGFPDKGIAVAVDWAVLPRSEWDDVLTEAGEVRAQCEALDLRRGADQGVEVQLPCIDLEKGVVAGIERITRSEQGHGVGV